MKIGKFFILILLICLSLTIVHANDENIENTTISINNYSEELNNIEESNEININEDSESYSEEEIIYNESVAMKTDEYEELYDIEYIEYDDDLNELEDEINYTINYENINKYQFEDKQADVISDLETKTQNFNSTDNTQSTLLNTQSTTNDNYTMKISLPSKIEAGTKINIKITSYKNNQIITNGKLNIKISNNNIGTYNINNNTTTIPYNVPENYNGNYKLTYSYIDTNNITKKTNNRNIIIIPKTFINSTVCNITVHNFNELKNTLETTNKTNYTINLAGSTTYYAGDEIYLNKTQNIIINGFNTILKSDYTYRFIWIQSMNTQLNIYNMTFKNFYEMFGAVFLNEGELNIYGSTFSNNYDNVRGGCIDNEGILKVSNCTFFNNSGSNGAAISSTNKLYVDKCIFSNNSNGRNGVIFVESASDLYINNSTFLNNEALIHGILEIINSKVKYINNSIFINNTSHYYSLINLDNSNLNISNCLFKNNKILKNEENSILASGVIKTNKELTLQNSTFSNNQVGYGGAIFTTNILNVSNSNFTNNTAIYGGAVYSNGKKLHITNARFENNTASKCGGAILQLNDSTITIEKSSFKNNKATAYDGGALYILNSWISINNTEFINNKANLTGGAILLELCDICSIENCSFTNNQANQKAGTINTRQSNLILSNNAIISNQQKNTIYLDKTSQNDIDNNWWGLNNPNFTITINNKTPEKWIQAIFTNQTTNNQNKLTFTLNQINTGEQYSNIIPKRTIKLKIGNTTKNLNLKNSTTYIYNGTEENITATIDNQNIPINTKLEPYFTTKNITAKAGDTINLTAYINKDIVGQTCIKVNGATIKNNNGTTLYFIPQDGKINYKYTIPKTTKNDLNISYVYGGNNKYQSYRLNSTVIIININQTDNTLLTNPTKKDVTFTAIDRIVIPGKKVDLVANINKDITGKIIIKINNTLLNNATISDGQIKYTYTIPTSWNNSYYKIQKVSFEYNGNTNYNSKKIYANLYIQPNNTTFNLKKYNLVTNVKDQGQSSSCWAFGLYSTLESDILKQTNKTKIFSENHIKNSINRNSINGIYVEPNTGKNTLYSTALLINWIEPIYESKDNYNAYSTFSPYLESDYHIQDIIFLPNRKNTSDNNLIKEYVLRYGAVGTSVAPKYKNYLNWYNSNSSQVHSHLIAIVGWDDNYNKNNFNDSGKIPEGNGAFLVKNSWGYVGDNGYSYISYYDKTLAGINVNNQFETFVFDLSNNNNYSSIYTNTKTAYKQINSNSSKVLWVKNNYVSQDNEIIQAVGTYFTSKSNYTIYIYKNDKLQYQQNGEVGSICFKTIQLNKYIPLKKGDNFTVIIKLNTPTVTNIIVQDNYETMINLNENTSFISVDGITWNDLSKDQYTACLNVYTQKTNESINTKTSTNDNVLNIKTFINSININANIKYYINNVLVHSVNNIKNNTYSFNYNVSNNTRREFNLTTVIINNGQIINETLNLLKNPVYTKSQLLLASYNLRSYINNNHKIPQSVKINGDTISINDYVYLISNLIYTNASSVELANSYDFIDVISDTNCYNVEINSSLYRNLSKEIKKCYEINSRNPKNIYITSYYLNFEDLVYFLSASGYFQYENNRLATYITVRDYITGYITQNITIKCPTDILYVNGSTEITTYFYYKNNRTVNNINASYKINGQNIATVLINNGIAKITYNTTTSQDILNLTITTPYKQDFYNAAAMQKMITVTKKPTKLSVNTWIFAKKNNNITLNIKVQDKDSQNITNGNVSFTINGNKISENNVNNGLVTIKYNTTNLPLGINNISIKYLENELYKSSSKTIKLKLENQLKTFTYNQILESANWTKNNIKNKTIPNQITINGTTISKDNYLYLLAQLIANNKTFYKLDLDTSTNNITTTCHGITINKTDYTNFAKQILTNYKNYNKQPSIIHTNFGYLSQDDTIKLLTDITNNLNTKKKLPEKITINSLTQSKCQSPIEYTLTIPCYENITLKQVITTNNNTMDKYIIQSGENGIIKVPTTRIINITIPSTNKTYTFTNKQLQNNYHNLQTSSCYITLDGKTIQNCSNNYQINKNQLFIYTSNDNIYIKYYLQTSQDINQFSILYNSQTKTYNKNNLPRTNNTLYTEKLLYNINNINKTLITISEGINYDDTGLKYQLYKQTKQTTNFNTTTYTQLLKTYTTPTFTNTNEKITYNNNKLLRNNITDIITTQIQTNQLNNTKTEKITYKNTTLDLIQTYILTRKTLNETDLLNFINTKNNYNQWIYNTTLIGIKTIYSVDKEFDIIQNITNTSYYRNTTTIILTGINNELYIENLDLTLSIKFNENETIQEMLSTVTTTILVDVENQLLNKTTINITKSYNNLTTILDNPTLNASIDNIFDETDNLLESVSDCRKSILYNFLNINEDETILEALIGGILGHSVAGQFAGIENTLGNIAMTVGFQVVAVAPEFGLPLIATGMLLSADSNKAFAQHMNLSRYFSTAIDVGLSATFKKTASIEPILKPAIAYLGRNANKKSTGVSNNEIFVESAFSILPNNVFSNNFDNVVKNELKNVYKDHEEIKIWGQTIAHRNVNLNEKTIAASLVGTVFLEKTADVSINTVINKAFKSYYQPQRE